MAAARPEPGSRVLTGAARTAVLYAAVVAAAVFQRSEVFASGAAVTTTPSSESAVRGAREAFNRAIVRRDAKAIGGFLAPTYHIVTGRGDQFHGGEDEAERWAERFRLDKTVTYRRTTHDVVVNEAWGLAQETGEWSGSYSAAGALMKASGVYAAKWQRAEKGDWRLQAEIFTTLKCEGATTGCVKPEPIRP